MNSSVPKQFLPLCGKPVLMHSVKAFHSYHPQLKIIIAMHPDLFHHWKTLCMKHSFNIPHTLSQGGEKRFDSVHNALSFLTSDSVVAVHDGVRPLVSVGLISRAFDHAVTNGNAIPVTPVTDSVRKSEGKTNSPVDRSSLRLIQTPQVFMASHLLKAYEQQYRESFTDDASVLEAAGYPINLIRGDQYNIKITYPEDLAIAEALMKYQPGL